MTLREQLLVSVQARHLLPGFGSPPDDYNYVCMEDYVLDRGREYKSQALDDDQRQAIFDVVDEYRLRFPVRQCFANCQKFVLEACDPLRFTYVEGYVSRGIPFLHAWIEVDEGQVFDPTLRFQRGRVMGRGRLRDRALGAWPDGDRKYLGVRFADVGEIRRHIISNQAHCSLIDDWTNNYPLLKEKRIRPWTDETTSQLSASFFPKGHESTETSS